MKLFDRFFESYLAKSRYFVQSVKTLADLTNQVNHLATLVMNLARVAEQHNDALNELIIANNALLAASENSGADMKLPNINKDREEKPN